VACDVERLRAAGLGLAEGVMALHRAGMVHRDIKPGNVLVSTDGRVRLLDFGLVREMELSNVQSFMLVGTPAYMAPEQLAQQPTDTAADWYSFGVMLFQALTGTFPPRPHLPPVDQGAEGRPLTVPVDAPTDLSELCIELLREAPASRPSGAEVLLRLGSIKRPGDRVMTAPGEDVLIGRESCLLELTQLVEVTTDGRPVFVNLSGKSGIGKSTLLRAFRRRLSRSDPTIVMLTGRCHENEMVPYKALDDLVDGLTGLAEYRNGGLFVDTGVLAFRDTEAAQQAHEVASTLVVEWRALTVALLDRVADGLRQRLKLDATSLPLAKILEGGTWAAGRLLARERRADASPPVKVISDGTVF
jgi:hypothetical protein